MLELQANFNGSSVYASAPSRPPAVFDSRLEPAVERIEILEAFVDLPDVRKASGKRHHLALCLALFTLAVTAGNRGFLAIKEGVRRVTKEPLCGGRAVGTGQEEIVDRGEGLEFARAEPVETMMAQRELAIRSGHKPGQGLQGDGAPQRRGLEGGPPDVVGAYDAGPYLRFGSRPD